MIKEITIKRLFRNDARKDGTPYVDKFGKKFVRVSIIAVGKDGNEYNMSNCDYKNETAELEEGKSYVFDIEKNGDFINFRLPRKVDLLETRIESIEQRLAKLEKAVPTKEAMAVADPKEFESFLNSPEATMDESNF